ncbi:SH2 domain-containing protein [Vibrio proteolyticus]
MTIKEQDVVKAKNRISELNDTYYAKLENYYKSLSGDNNNDQRTLLLEVQRVANKYFNYCEEFVGNSSLLGAHQDALWAQGFAEDCLSVLKIMPKHYQLLQREFRKLEIDVDIHPNETAFANMQRLANKYLEPHITNPVVKQFQSENLPIYGFQYEEKSFMSHKLQRLLSFGFGVFFVLLLLATAFITPNPSSYQYTVFRIVLALAGGGIVAVFPGFIEVKFGNWLRAGGALAVFAVIYTVSPAALDTNHSENPPQEAPIISEARQ